MTLYIFFYSYYKNTSVIKTQRAGNGDETVTTVDTWSVCLPNNQAVGPLLLCVMPYLANATERMISA